ALAQHPLKPRLIDDVTAAVLAVDRTLYQDLPGDDETSDQAQGGDIEPGEMTGGIPVVLPERIAGHGLSPAGHKMKRIPIHTFCKSLSRASEEAESPLFRPPNPNTPSSDCCVENLRRRRVH